MDHDSDSKILPTSWQDVGMASLIMHDHVQPNMFYHRSRKAFQDIPFNLRRLAKLSLHDSLSKILTRSWQCPTMAVKTHAS